MHRFALLALACLPFLTIGCANSSDRIAAAAIEEVARLEPPTRPLSGYSSFILSPMVNSDGVAADDAKVKYAGRLEAKLVARLTPLLGEWHGQRASAPAPAPGSPSGSLAGGTLEIRPELKLLRIVGGAARFWAGAFAGQSEIEMDLVLTDRASGEVIARPRIGRSASGMAGGWTIGASDKALLDYIVEISHRYLASHHGDRQGPIDAAGAMPDASSGSEAP